MRIFVAGGAGYIGTVLVPELVSAGHDVTVYDRFYFGDEPFARLREGGRVELVRGDVRSVSEAHLRGHDAAVDLAGLSNDPAADLDPALTEAINHGGALRVARAARAAGVGRLVYSSSCSIYGAAGSSEPRTEESEAHPVSLYARMKVETDEELRAMASPSFVVTALRNATVYGVSPRMRFDLVVNLMTLYAVREKKIYVLGGGRQWRPLVHVKDVARAFQLALEAPADTVNAQAFNTGSDDQNHRVSSIAAIVASIVPQTEIEQVPDDQDKRSYRVSFAKIARVLGFRPRCTVADGVREIAQALQQGEVEDTMKTRTVAYYRFLLDAERLVREVAIDGKVL